MAIMIANDDGLRLLIGLVGHTTDLNGVSITQDRLLRLPLPGRIVADDVAAMRHDLEAVLSAIEQEPQKFQDLHGAVMANDLTTAGRLARELGLTEDQLVERGGGVVGPILVGVAVAAAILLWASTADAPTTAPDAGAPDAGPG